MTSTGKPYSLSDSCLRSLVVGSLGTLGGSMRADSADLDQDHHAIHTDYHAARSTPLCHYQCDRHRFRYKATDSV